MVISVWVNLSNLFLTTTNPTAIYKTHNAITQAFCITRGDREVIKRDWQEELIKNKLQSLLDINNSARQHPLLIWINLGSFMAKEIQIMDHSATYMTQILFDKCILGRNWRLKRYTQFAAAKTWLRQHMWHGRGWTWPAAGSTWQQKWNAYQSREAHTGSGENQGGGNGSGLGRGSFSSSSTHKIQTSFLEKDEPAGVCYPWAW